jgi:hypothetical protein
MVKENLVTPNVGFFPRNVRFIVGKSGIPDMDSRKQINVLGPGCRECRVF